MGGAPAELLNDAQLAAADEIRHAQICFSFAAAFGSESPSPSAFPFDSKASASIDTDLAGMAAATAREGCVNETISASMMAVAASQAKDPAVRSAMESIVEDESRHAALAWRTVKWALEKGGYEVQQALKEAFSQAPGENYDGGASNELTGHGFLSSQDANAAARHTFDRIIKPAAALLLGTPSVNDCLGCGEGTCCVQKAVASALA